jgi:hypothetical protein
MGIYTAPGVLAYKVNGATLNTSLTLKAGINHTVVQEWDHCGGAATTPIALTVGSISTSGTFANLHQQSGWRAMRCFRHFITSARRVYPAALRLRGPWQKAFRRLR